MMKMTEMADAKAGDLEDEDRVAVRDAVRAAEADIGRDVADADIADLEIVVDRPAVRIPAAQHMLDPGVGKVCVMRAMRMVHGDDVGDGLAGITRIVGGDPDAAGAFDEEGRVADEGELHLALLELGGQE